MNPETRVPRPLELGFIGGGLRSVIGPTHVTASRMDGRFTPVAGCFSHDADVARESGAQYGIAPERCGHDWRRWLETEHGRLDAVAILTPIPMHREMIEHALALGVPIIAEKALVADVVEADALAAAVEHHRHFLAVTLNYSGYPAVRRLRKMIADGALGTLLQMQLEMPLENYLRVPVGGDSPAEAQAWRRVDGTVPTLLLDLGVHLQHLLSYLTGEPVTEVMADLHRSEVGLVDDARVWLRGDGGLDASMWMSKRALGHRNGLRVRAFGDRGSAEWFQNDPETLKLVDAHGRRSELDRGLEDDLLGLARYNRFKAGHPAGFLEAFANLYADIADALEQHRTTDIWHSDEVFGLEHSRDGLAVLEAAVRADRERRWCAVERRATAALALAA